MEMNAITSVQVMLMEHRLCLKQRKLGISPEQLIQNIQKEHLKSYSKYLINFSNFYSTHSDENKTFSEEIYQLAQNNGTDL